MEIYDFANYKDFVRATIAASPNKGRGQLAQISRAIGVNSTLMSQVFNGERNLTEEQAYGICEFFGLNPKETLYFLLLLQKDRAGNFRLKKLFEKQIAAVQKESKFLKNRVQPEKVLTFDQQANYYSNWILTAIHTLSSIPGFNSVHVFSKHLNISIAASKRAVDTLLEFGLCVEKNGEIHIGPKSTFISGDSPLVTRHHGNWRTQALLKMSDYTEDHFHYTLPFSISLEDYALIRKQLVKLIEDMGKRIDKTEAVEQAACLNIDLFKF